MFRKIFYIFSFLVCSFAFGQKDLCDKKKHIGLYDVSKCVVVKPKRKIPVNVSKTIVTKPRRKRIRLRRKRNKSSLISSNKLASIRKVTEMVGKIKLDKTIDKLPLALVDSKPVFEKCKGIDFVNQEKCFKQQMGRHIQKNFRYPEEAHQKGIQGRVLARFVIDEYGVVDEIEVAGPYKGQDLEKEAKRIIKKLPKFQAPGKMAGNVVKVKHSISIEFKIAGVEPTNVLKKNKQNVALVNVKNMTDVDQLPRFSACKNIAEAGQNKCFIGEMMKHVNANIIYPEDAVKDNIQGRVYTQFVIDKEGDVVNVTTKGAPNSESLQEEAKRIMMKLPKFIPAKIKGNPINVKYTFPITFKL